MKAATSVLTTICSVFSVQAQNTQTPSPDRRAEDLTEATRNSEMVIDLHKGGNTAEVLPFAEKAH